MSTTRCGTRGFAWRWSSSIWTGQVAIVTGAGKGVGQGIARVLAEAGATVVGTARTESDIVGTIAGIEERRRQGTGTRRGRHEPCRTASVSSTRPWRSFGRIDILVNNVGGSTYARFLDITDDDFRHTFDWCVTSAFIMSQLAAPHMIEAGHGSIVNISSGSARFGIRALTAYCVAKGGLEALTRAMAQELAPKIRVNAIALGSFATDGLQGSLDMMPGSLEKMQESTPLHRLGDVADLGRLSVYLSTRDCYATNAIFHVDGGIDSNNSPLPIPDY